VILRKKSPKKLSDICINFENTLELHLKIYYNYNTRCGGKWSEDGEKCLTIPSSNPHP
jgi:hypothetical protein